MNFDLNKSLEILERTPKVLDILLNGLSRDWIDNNEGEVTGTVTLEDGTKLKVQFILRKNSGGNKND